MFQRLLRLTTFEVRKLMARRLVLAAVLVIGCIAGLSRAAGRAIDTAGALARGQAAATDPFKNGWTTIAGGVGSALPFAVLVLLVFAGTSIAEEQQQGTLKALLVRPVRRGEVLISKTLALFTLALVLVLVMTGAAALVASLGGGLGDIVDPDHTDYVIHKKGDMTSFTVQAVLLLLPSFLAVIAWGLLWSATIDHAGYAVGGAISGSLFLGVVSGLSSKLGPLLFVSWVARPFALLGDIGEAFSGAKTLFADGRLPAIAVPVISAGVFLGVAALRLSRRDIGEV